MIDKDYLDLGSRIHQIVMLLLDFVVSFDYRFHAAQMLNKMMYKFLNYHNAHYVINACAHI